jgi:hypothetical protein
MIRKACGLDYGRVCEHCRPMKRGWRSKGAGGL